MDASDFSDPANAADVEAILGKVPAPMMGEDDAEGTDADGLDVASEELIAAVGSGDPAAVSAALRSAFAMLRAAPDDE